MLFLIKRLSKYTFPPTPPPPPPKANICKYDLSMNRAMHKSPLTHDMNIHGNAFNVFNVLCILSSWKKFFKQFLTHGGYLSFQTGLDEQTCSLLIDGGFM